MLDGASVMAQGSSTKRFSPAVRGPALAELERLAASPTLRGAARQVRLLRFLVGEVLEGRGQKLTAAVVATRVFDRPEGFDTTVDSIVRVETSKLRRALAGHYALAGAAEICIVLPRGSYAPVFVRPSEDAPRARDSQPPQSREAPAGCSMETALDDLYGPVFAILPFAAVAAVAEVSTNSLPSHGNAPGAEPPRSGTDTRGRAFAHGLTERLGALFARAPCVAVVSRAASLEDAAARGARYVLEGSVRLVPGALRVTAKVHDTRRWIQIWGNAYDRFDPDDRLFAVEDEIAREIAIQVVSLPQGAVHAVEARERSDRPPRSTYELTLRFLPWSMTFDLQIQEEIKQACARVVPRDEERGVLFAFSSFVHLLSAWTASGSDRDRRLGADEARLAVMVEPLLANSHQAHALALLDAGDGRGARAAAEIALSLGGALMLTGMLLALAGEWERGTAVLRAHLAALKRHPGGAHHVFALDAYRRGDFATALAEAEAISAPNLAWDPLDRAVALARLGRIPEARAAGRALTALLPEIATVPRAFVARLTADEALIDDLVEALRLAGIG